MIDKIIIDYEKLKWDTDFFGFECGKIKVNNDLSEDDIYLIEQHCNLNRFTSIHSSSSSNNLFLLNKLDDSYLVDMPCRMEKTLCDNTDQTYKGVIKRDMLSKVEIERNLPRLLEIAGSAFQDGRFYRDMNISSEKASLLYEKWLINALNDNRNIVFSQNFDGFLIYNIHENFIDIDLIAVDKERRGEGIGQNLINFIFHEAFKKDLTKIVVYTQFHNYKAINFYAKNLFKIVEISSIFHVWRNI